MLEFLKNTYFIPLYAIALIISVIRYRWYFNTVLRYLPIIICYTLICEILGLLIRDYEIFQLIYDMGYSSHNAVIYNIFDIVFYLYFYYVFWKILTKPKSKKIIVFGAILFIAVSFINPFFQSFLTFPQTYAILVGSGFLICCTLFYFSELKSIKGKIPNHRNLLFWISAGLLGFHSLYPIFMFIVAYSNYDIYTKFHIGTMHRLSIAYMYICFIIGFLRMKGRFSKTTAIK